MKRASNRNSRPAGKYHWRGESRKTCGGEAGPNAKRNRRELPCRDKSGHEIRRLRSDFSL